jgi:hypothetical protein
LPSDLVCPIQGALRVKKAVFVLFAFAWFAPFEAEAQQYGSVKQAITGGRPADRSEIYSTVAIIWEDPETEELWAHCTGTLIAPGVVLTAAHCVFDEDPETEEIYGELAPASLWVVVGSLVPEEARYDVYYEVERITAHREYPGDEVDDPTGLGRFNDLAILLLAEDVQGMKPARILRRSEFGRLVQGISLWISGYGVTDLDTEDSGVLYIAETPFHSRNDSELFAGARNEPDACMGDSGGPAYLFDGGGYWLVGVTSRGRDDSDLNCGEGGIYALAGAYLDWIELASGGAYRTNADYDWGVSPPPGAHGGDGDEDNGGGGSGCTFGRSASTSWWFSLLLLALLARSVTPARSRRRRARP